MKFCERLKEMRIKRGYTQDEFAKILNISTSSISLYENGDREPSLSMLKTISETLNVSSDYLLGLTDNKNNDGLKLTINDLKKIIDRYISEELNDK